MQDINPPSENISIPQLELKNRRLKAHLEFIPKLLRSNYEASKNWQNPYDIGQLREEFVRRFLKFHLPSIYEIEQGEIIDYQGNSSRQQDCIVYRKDSPKLAITEKPKILFIEGCCATFEIKSDLKYNDFKVAFENVMSVRNLIPKINPFAVGDRAGYVFTYIFSYKGPSDETIIRYYNDFAREMNWTIEDSLNNIPDALYILDGPLFYKNDGWAWRKTVGPGGIVVPYSKVDPPHSFLKFFFHTIQATSRQDIYNIAWDNYLK